MSRDAGGSSTALGRALAFSGYRAPVCGAGREDVYKRQAGFFVGQLVQEAGLRGYRVGGAQVSEKHTGFVVNAGGATAADVRRLIADVQERVRASAGVDLEPEVRMWGFEE